MQKTGLTGFLFSSVASVKLHQWETVGKRERESHHLLFDWDLHQLACCYIPVTSVHMGVLIAPWCAAYS